MAEPLVAALDRLPPAPSPNMKLPFYPNSPRDYDREWEPR